MTSYDDIPIFLAVARLGTTGKAAAAVGCSQPTVVRRIAALEQSLGLQLFTRSANGLELTEQGEALLDAAKSVEAAMRDVDDVAASLNSGTGDRITLTLLDQFDGFLIPVLRTYCDT